MKKIVRKSPVKNSSAQASRMKLPASFTTVTPFSRGLAMVLFIVLPFCGFLLGRMYQQALTFCMG
jgi:hypothetical protein